MYEAPLDRILRFLKDLYSNGPFKAFFDGDPLDIPTSKLPAICVVKAQDTTGVGPTGRDRIIEEITIKVVLNKRDDFKTNPVDIDLTEKRIRDLVEARDKTTGQYLPQSIKGALRTKLTMENIALNQTMTFELGIVPRTEKLLTSEGHLTITVTYDVPIANRT